MSLPFDPGAPTIQRWLTELNVALDDVRSAVEDRLRKRRKRDLGHRQHAHLIGDGFEKIDQLLGRKPTPTHH